MSSVRVNSITNRSDDGPVELTYGADVPSIVSGNISLSGIVTATTFSGNGSQLTGIPITTISKAIAFKYILADPPLRA